MTARDPNSEIHRDDADQSEGEGIDAERVKEVVGFVWHAARRRPKLAISTFVVIAAFGATISATMPRTYNSQVKLLAQHDLVMPTLSNPNRAVPREADNPTRNVTATIVRRDNLVALVREANLLEKWHASRSAALRFKDRIFGMLSAPPREEDEVQALAQTLEKRLTVSSDESTVIISVDWNEPQTAYELVKLIQKNFIEARYDSEVTMIQDAIGVLEEHARNELEQVDSALTAYQALRGNGSAPAAPSIEPTPSGAPSPLQRAPSPARVAQVQAPPAPEIDADLTKALEDKRRQIRTVEESRQRTLDALKQQLVQAQLTLTEMHPTVIALQQKIEALSDPPPELTTLKNEERALMSEIAPAPVSGAPPPPHPLTAGNPVVELRRAIALPAELKASQQDPSLAPARSRLDAAIFRYQNVMANIDSAKLELDITRTAFRYRYSVITPAELPRGPKKPIALLVGVGSVLGAIVVAMLGAASADWQGGRILEAWQVKRRLKLEVLGELEPPL
jgi:uncharacterized protein involved in exopolysaccharide biosynthesis